MASLESINELLVAAAEKLDQAATEINDLPLSPTKDHIQLVGEALANIFEIQRCIYHHAPELQPEMEEEDYEPDCDLTNEQQAIAEELSPAELERIDLEIMSHAIDRWRKVAMIVGLSMMELKGRPAGLPDVFYAQRVKKLVEEGKLEADGNLDYMRYSEVRLPVCEAETT